MSQKKFWPIILIGAVLVLVACNMPASSTPPTADQGAIYTQAAMTVMVQLTQIAEGTSAAPAPTDPIQQPTEDSQPTGSPSPTTTPLPTATPMPTNTPLPTATATSQPTPTPVPCNWAEFIKDVTVPDGTKFASDSSFTKTWRLKNIGSCTWTSDYKLVFYKGDEMDGSSVQMPDNVRPGESIDLSVDLIAPSQGGTYQGYWILRDSDGRFGIGDNADKPFWVEIKVVEATSGIVYNFVNNYCQADWTSGAGDLPCPGKSGQTSGFVIRLDRPDQENRKENEPALWTNPEKTDNGWITGTFPAFKVKSGDRFIADIGCLADNKNCDVLFQLNYRLDNPNLKQLGEWHEVYDGKITRVDVDLSSLEDKKVEFVLTVLANGSSKDDAAFWLVPQIYREP